MGRSWSTELHSYGILDLFCGAGGLSAGFERAGFPIISAADNNEKAIQTYEFNHECEPIAADLTNDSALPKLRQNINTNGYSPKDIEVVIGGPPCKGFSQANKQTGNLENPKNDLASRFVEIALDFDPKVVVMENVPNMLSMNDGHFKEKILKRLQSFDYNVTAEEVRADRFGVPQTRNRAFIIAVDEGKPPVISELASHFPTPVKVKNAIFDLPDLPTGGGGSEVMEYTPHLLSKFKSVSDTSYIEDMRENADPEKVHNHKSTRNREKTYRRFKHIPQGGNWKDIPSDLMDNYKNLERTHDNIYHRLSEDELAKTVANFRKQMMIHPIEDRLLTVREAARLQSFPDDYRFVNSGICAKQQMVGNAVPVRLAEGVALAVSSYLLGDQFRKQETIPQD